MCSSRETFAVVLEFAPSLTRPKVWNLTQKMLGNQETYNLNAKAAESHGLLRFMEWFLTKYGPDFAALEPEVARRMSLLQSASQAALSMDVVLRQEGRTMGRSQCQTLFQNYMRFLTLYLRAGGVWRPKCHLLVHLIQRALVKGNPRLYSTYRDESLNGIIAKIARSAHRRTWANVIHWKCNRFHKKNFDSYLEQ